VRQSGVYAVVHAPDSAAPSERSVGPGVRKAPVPTRTVLSNALNAVLRERGWANASNGELARRWHCDAETVRDMRAGAVRLTAERLESMGDVGREVMARFGMGRAA
jgi:hypothetical protein